MCSGGCVSRVNNLAEHYFLFIVLVPPTLCFVSPFVSQLDFPASGKKGLTEETGINTVVPAWQRAAKAPVARETSSEKVRAGKKTHSFLQLLSNASLGSNFKITSGRNRGIKESFAEFMSQVSLESRAKRENSQQKVNQNCFL